MTTANLSLDLEKKHGGGQLARTCYRMEQETHESMAMMGPAWPFPHRHT